MLLRQRNTLFLDGGWGAVWGDAMSKQSCLCAHAVGKSTVFEALWSQIMSLQASPWSWLSQSDSKVMESALQNCKGKRMLAEMGDRMLKIISSIQVLTPQLKLKHTQIPSSGFVDTKWTINKYYYWLLHDKMGKFCEKRKNLALHQCLLYDKRCSGRHAPESLA